MVLRLFFDTETNGKPSDKDKGSETPIIVEPDYWPDIISICWMIYDDNLHIRTVYSIVNPLSYRNASDITWDMGAQRVHGITLEDAKKGDSLENVLGQFKRDYELCDKIIAHNLRFDRNVIVNAFELVPSVDFEWNLEKDICTLCEAKKLIAKNNIPVNSVLGYRSFNLNNLYRHAFGKDAPADAHNALRDVEVLKDVYFKLSGPGGDFTLPSLHILHSLPRRPRKSKNTTRKSLNKI